MAVSGAIIDYTGAAGERNFTVFIQLTFSGSFTTGGDPLNLATLSNPNGLDVEGVFELPLSLGPAVYLEDIGGYYVQPKVTGSTVNAFLINVYAPGGIRRFRSLQRGGHQRKCDSYHAEASRLKADLGTYSAYSAYGAHFSRPSDCEIKSRRRARLQPCRKRSLR